MAVISQHLGKEALDALGLPTKGCVSLTLKFEVNNIVVVTADYAPDYENADRIISIVKRLKPADE